MCIGENSAPHVQHYLNAQLTALWENAVECVSHHGKPGLKPDDNQKYSFALAEFFYGKHRPKGHASKADMMFHASFGRPRLEFICNHDAILHLTLKEGHYNSQVTKATHSHAIADHSRNHSFSDIHVSFRIPFGISGLRGQDGKIGNGHHVIKLFVLDFNKARLVDLSSTAEAGRQALSTYLHHYLQFLNSAGHHVLFSLPDFDDDDLSITIDFSTLSSVSIPFHEVSTVSVERINAFLSTAWLKSAMIATSHHSSTDIKISLAEFRSTSLAHAGDFHFHLKFGAPRIRAICDQEVILYLTLDDVHIYQTDDFSGEPIKTFQNWEIAVLVYLETTHEEEGNVTRCRLDFDTARFVRQYCNFPGFDDFDTHATRYWTRIVEFVTVQYLEILERAEFHIIFHHDRRWPKPAPIPTGHPRDEDIDVIDGAPDEGGSGGWTDVTKHADMCDFDQIMAISQSGIIAHFLTLYKDARMSNEGSLLSWSYDDYFQATFKPMTLRLLSNGRAIVWVHLQEGFLRTLKNWLPWSEGTKYNFEDWSLAFEVDIKITNHANLHDMSSGWVTKFQDSHAFKEHGHHNDRVLKHIYLDFRNAEFVHEFSSFEGLFHVHAKRPIEKVQAVVTYIKNHYFHRITSSGYHILHTVPVWNAGSAPPSYGLTSVAFHVYCKHNLERHTWGAFSKVDEPVIVILGMGGFRPLPSVTLKYTTHWIVQVIKGISYGTVALSKRVFLDDRLLSLLARINAITTVVPLFAGVDNGAWRLDLTTWAKHEIRRSRPCKWVDMKEEHGVLKYKWEHRDEWKYEHEGSAHITNGVYTTSCVTKNYLEIPTTFKKGSLEIKIKGDVTLRMGYNGNAHSWSTQSAAHWSSGFLIKSDYGGIKVELLSTATPKFHTTEIDPKSKLAAVYAEPEALLKSQLPATIEFADVLAELKHFEGAWHTCYPGGLSAYELTQPVFNHAGDLLFRLRPFGTSPPPSPVRVGSGSHVHVTVGRSSVSSVSISSSPSVSAGPTSSGANGKGSIGNGKKPRPGLGGSLGKLSKPSITSRHPSFIHKVKEAAHTWLAGEPTHSGEDEKHQHHQHHNHNHNHSHNGSITNGDKHRAHNNSSSSSAHTADDVPDPVPLSVGGGPTGRLL